MGKSLCAAKFNVRPAERRIAMVFADALARRTRIAHERLTVADGPYPVRTAGDRS